MKKPLISNEIRGFLFGCKKADLRGDASLRNFKYICPVLERFME